MPTKRMPWCTSTKPLLAVNFLWHGLEAWVGVVVGAAEQASKSKSHSTSVFSEVRTRSREVTGEMLRGPVRKAMPEKSRVVPRMLRGPLVSTAPPKLGSRKYFCATRQLIHSRLPQVGSAASSLPEASP